MEYLTENKKPTYSSPVQLLICKWATKLFQQQAMP